jgi:hypothetical protein
VSRIDHWFSVPFTGIGIIGLLCREHRSVAGLTRRSRGVEAVENARIAIAANVRFGLTADVDAASELCRFF